MADTATKPQLAWPGNSWAILKKIVRAWYAAEQGGGEVSQKRIAQMADAHPSQVSTNKAFLQWVGIVEPEGLGLTEAGKRFGLGLADDNENYRRQGLQEVIRDCSLLRNLLDIVRGRGSIKESNLEAEVSLLTKQGKTIPGFTAGVSVIQDMLIDSGQIERVGNSLRPSKGYSEEGQRNPPKPNIAAAGKIPETGLRRIPIPVSATAIWYVEVGEGSNDAEIDTFIEMQKLIFSRK